MIFIDGNLPEPRDPAITGHQPDFDRGTNNTKDKTKLQLTGTNELADVTKSP